MSVAKRDRSSGEIAKAGKEIYGRQVRPRLGPEDDGKFVALDIDSGDYELDQDDYAAVMRRRHRRPSAEIWLERAGYAATYKMRRVL